MKLTDEQLERLPERGAKAGKWANAILDWRADGHPDCHDCEEKRHSLQENEADRTAYLCGELAHALEQVAAAKLMAEALEKLKNMIDADGPPSLEWLAISTHLESDVMQALAAWKALETTQDGESGGA